MNRVTPTCRLIMLLLTIIMSSVAAWGQIVIEEDQPVYNADSLRAEYDKAPTFGMYKDNYFVFGTALNHRPNRENTNVKFQISIQMKLTRSTLPFNTYLYLYYTQKVFWNVLEKSMPMTDLNFNPGIGIAKPLFNGDRYLGRVYLQVEHESNGRDSIQSRSWNKISLGANILIEDNLTVHGRFWIPIVDGQNNKDILKYKGIYQVGVQYKTKNKKWAFNLMLEKRKTWKPNYNIIGDIQWYISNKVDWCIFAQYFSGYGESLLYYNKYVNQLRIGIGFAPKLFSIY